MNRLAAVATLHGCSDSSLYILNTLYGYSAMEMQEAFVKIREQAKAYLERPAELQVSGGRGGITVEWRAGHGVFGGTCRVADWGGEDWEKDAVGALLMRHPPAP